MQLLSPHAAPSDEVADLLLCLQQLIAMLGSLKKLGLQPWLEVGTEVPSPGRCFPLAALRGFYAVAKVHPLVNRSPFQYP